MWGLYAQITELQREVEDLKEQLRRALAINEQQLREIDALKDVIRFRAKND